jgi:peptide/nickel transport system permease protein
MELYGFNRSYPEQFLSWVWRALHGDLGSSIATAARWPPRCSRRSAIPSCWPPWPPDRFRLRFAVRIRGGYFRNSWIDRLASFISVVGVSVLTGWAWCW